MRFFYISLYYFILFYMILHLWTFKFAQNIIKNYINIFIIYMYRYG